MTTPITRIQTDDEFLNRVQDALVPPINALIGHPILDGRIVETYAPAGQEIALVLSTTPTSIAHKLGRAYKGFWLISRNANAVLWEDPIPGANPDNKIFIRLVASATVTVKLWVF